MSGISTPTALRFTGRLADLSRDDRNALRDRMPTDATPVTDAVAAIIDDVRTRGDSALRDMAQRFDGATLDALEVPRATMQMALDRLDPALRRAMERSARNIRAVHQVAMPSGVECEVEPGLTVGRRPDPLGRIGVYAPGGRAAYPSSVLMGVIPARVAGVGEIILCSPPGPDGLPSPVVLAAAALADVDRVFAIGGAGAIAAMALGTDTVPRVDRIVGPGNAFVAEAKLQLVGSVAIDSPAGPSELLVIADDTADPELVATEMVAQAEHDPLACVVAVCVGSGTATRIADAVSHVAAAATRATIVAAALEGQGGVLQADTLADAIAFSNEYAPEHLLLMVASPDEALQSVRNAGMVFVGASASVAFGDYISGANHVLPTGGLARSYSGLSTVDFIRWTTWQRITPAAATSLSPDTATFADAEGLPGHAAAARARAGR